MLLGGLGGVLADRYLFPYLVTNSFFSKYEFLKRTTENVTIINKTEQVFMKEETSIDKIVGKLNSSSVSVLIYSDQESRMIQRDNNRTGLIVTSDGIIMTYLPNIALAEYKYKVIMPDKNIYDAELLGTDSYSNLTFLKIPVNNLQTVAFGNSDEIKPGEKIIAIGKSEDNYANRYAVGLLSNFNAIYNLSGQTISSSEKMEGVFQSDIIFDQLFVGGPIVDYTSQVIGVTGSLERDGRTEYFQIPSNKIKNILNRVIKNELAQNPILGIYYLPLTKSLALTNNIEQENGAWIYSSYNQTGLAIIQGSVAQKAGLKLNDIIVNINKEEINNSGKSLPDILYQYRKGDKIDLEVIRDKQNIKIEVQL